MRDPSFHTSTLPPYRGSVFCIFGGMWGGGIYCSGVVCYGIMAIFYNVGR